MIVVIKMNHGGLVLLKAHDEKIFPWYGEDSQQSPFVKIVGLSEVYSSRPNVRLLGPTARSTLESEIIATWNFTSSFSHIPKCLSDHTNRLRLSKLFLDAHLIGNGWSVNFMPDHDAHLE